MYIILMHEQSGFYLIIRRRKERTEKMETNIQNKIEAILSGRLKYTSSNLAFNMLISKLQKKVKADPGCIKACVEEVDAFVAKYPIVAKVDFINISAL